MNRGALVSLCFLTTILSPTTKSTTMLFTSSNEDQMKASLPECYSGPTAAAATGQEGRAHRPNRVILILPKSQATGHPLKSVCNTCLYHKQQCLFIAPFLEFSLMDPALQTRQRCRRRSWAVLSVKCASEK